jgi:hypothetical protein
MGAETDGYAECNFESGERLGHMLPRTGIAFLLSEKVNKDQRKGAGWVLLGIGVISSIPILVDFVTKPTGAEKLLAMAS